MKSIILIFSMLSLLAIESFAKETIDFVYLKDSTLIKGNIIIQIPNDRITIRDFSNRIYEIKYEDIQVIRTYNLEDISINHKSYYELGASVGFPAIVNINANGYLGLVGFGVSGMFWGTDSYGYQLNFNIKISDNYISSQGISFVFSNYYQSSPIDRPVAPYFNDKIIFDFMFYSVAYHLNYRGFWLEVGPGMGLLYHSDEDYLGDEVYPAIAFQIGYVYRFVK